MTKAPMSENLANPCFYRENGIHCESGLLYHTTSGEAVLVEGTNVYCPACEGKRYILTDRGRDLIAFLQTFGKPFLREIMDELFREREQHE